MDSIANYRVTTGKDIQQFYWEDNLDPICREKWQNIASQDLISLDVGEHGVDDERHNRVRACARTSGSPLP